VDEDLNDYFADLLYTCQLRNGEQVRIALLFEHKSYPEKHPHFQLLRYLLNAWQQADAQSEPLLPILPVVFYHGLSPWKTSTLTDYFGPVSDWIRPFLPEFSHLLIDLNEYDAPTIIAFENHFLALATLLMKIRRMKQFLERYAEPISQLLRFIEADQDMPFIRTAFIYIYEAGRLPLTDIVRIFEYVSTKTAMEALSTADQLRLEGRNQATFTYVRGLLALGLSADKIAQAFQLPLPEVEAIIRQIRADQAN
jgi:predicted transposase/invertase (TIGR01784 family)